MDLAEARSALEKDRRTRLRALGVSQSALKASELKPVPQAKQDNNVRVMQWNLLADGMSDDGFLVNDVLQDWPAGSGNVPTSDGASVAFNSLLTQMMSARGDSDALEKLKDRYSVKAAESNAEAVVAWEGRLPQIQLQVLASGRPDVLVFQECDHFGPLAEGLAKLGYSCSLPSVDRKTEPYKPAHLAGLNPTSAKGGAAEYREAIEKKGYAFFPNIGSTALNLMLNSSLYREKFAEGARKLGLESQLLDVDKEGCAWIKKRSFSGFATGPLFDEAGVDPLSVDDDGVAIFWRTDRFTADSMKVHLYPNGQSGALQVRLRENSYTGRHLVLLGAHLSSGDDLKAEDKRLSNEVNVSGGLRDICTAAREAHDTVVLSLDSNSHPQIGAENSGSSCWSSLHGVFGASVWDSHFDKKGDALVCSSETSLDPPVSSNKLRGPLSTQPKKIGLHSYYCIDHIFFTAGDLSMEGHVYPLQQFPSGAEARGTLNPSLSCPSDHYPVVVDLNWPVMVEGNKAHMKVGAGKPASVYARAAAALLQGTEEKKAASELHISALGNAIDTASKVATGLERDGIGIIGRIYTDYVDMRETTRGRGILFCPHMVIVVKNVNASV